jgi:L-aminopeptidase/D-esterase-like protein
VATDAPLLPHQLKRIVTRVSLGIGRQGGFGGNSSGDIFIAFSTANPRAWFNDQPVTSVQMLPSDRISPLFQATAQATEAAITNARWPPRRRQAPTICDLRDAGRSDARRNADATAP